MTKEDIRGELVDTMVDFLLGEMMTRSRLFKFAKFFRLKPRIVRQTEHGFCSYYMQKYGKKHFAKRDPVYLVLDRVRRFDGEYEGDMFYPSGDRLSRIKLIIKALLFLDEKRTR